MENRWHNTIVQHIHSQCEHLFSRSSIGWALLRTTGTSTSKLWERQLCPTVRRRTRILFCKCRAVSSKTSPIRGLCPHCRPSRTPYYYCGRSSSRQWTDRKARILWTRCVLLCRTKEWGSAEEVRCDRWTTRPTIWSSNQTESKPRIAISRPGHPIFCAVQSIKLYEKLRKFQFSIHMEQRSLYRLNMVQSKKNCLMFQSNLKFSNLDSNLKYASNWPIVEYSSKSSQEVNDVKHSNQAFHRWEALWKTKQTIEIKSFQFIVILFHTTSGWSARMKKPMATKAPWTPM